MFLGYSFYFSAYNLDLYFRLYSGSEQKMSSRKVQSRIPVMIGLIGGLID